MALMHHRWPDCHQPSRRTPDLCRLCGRPMEDPVEQSINPAPIRASTHPLNLAPIRAAVHVWQANQARGQSAAENVNLAAYAAHIIPTLCDEIVRLRAELADIQVVQP